MPEKNDFNSLLFLLTPGVESSKAGTLLSALAAFKKLHDDNAPLEDVLTEFVKRRPARYRRPAPARSLRADARLLPSRPAPARCSRRSSSPITCRRWRCRRMRPRRCWCATRWTTCRSTEIEGRIATTLFVVYPPGIATIVPGRAPLDRACQADARLPQDVRAGSANQFPGFEAEIQGLFREVEPDGTIRFHTYVWASHDLDRFDAIRSRLRPSSACGRPTTPTCR